MNALNSFFTRLDARPLAILFFLLPFVIFYHALCSFWTSPLLPLFNGDSAAFFAMGDGLLNGKLPYRDLFDHKGPFLYVIYALGQWLAGLKMGVTLLQWGNFLLCAYCSYRIARLKLSPVLSWFAVALLAFCCSGCLCGGGLTEEWSLFISLLPFYCVVKRLCRNHQFAPFADAPLFFALGVAVGLHTMLRATNAAVVCGIIAFLGLLFIFRHSWKLVASLSLFSLIGFIVAVLPFVCWYAKNDALDDFWFGVFGYNLLYSAAGTAGKSAGDWLKIFICTLFVPLFAWQVMISLKNRNNLPLSIHSFVVALFCLLALIPGNTYSHYFLMAAPCLLWAIIVVLAAWQQAKSRRQKVLKSCLCCLLVAFYVPEALVMYAIGAANIYHTFVAPDNYKIFGVKECWYDEHQAAKAIEAQLPNDVEAQVLAYSPNPGFLLYMNRRPCYKYFFIQSAIQKTFPDARKEMESYFAQADTADWVICTKNYVRMAESASEQASPEPLAVFLRNRCQMVGVYGQQTEYFLFKRVK